MRWLRFRVPLSESTSQRLDAEHRPLHQRRGRVSRTATRGRAPRAWWCGGGGERTCGRFVLRAHLGAQPPVLRECGDATAETLSLHVACVSRTAAVRAAQRRARGGLLAGAVGILTVGASAVCAGSAPRGVSHTSHTVAPCGDSSRRGLRGRAATHRACLTQATSRRVVAEVGRPRVGCACTCLWSTKPQAGHAELGAISPDIRGRSARAWRPRARCALQLPQAAVCCTARMAAARESPCASGVVVPARSAGRRRLVRRRPPFGVIASATSHAKTVRVRVLSGTGTVLEC